MPKYLARQQNAPAMSKEALESLKAKLSKGEPDQFGVIGRNMFVGKDQTYYYAEAPNPEAVQKAQEAMGVKLGADDITEVESLLV